MVQPSYDYDRLGRRLRLRILEMCRAAGGGHLGGSFSVVDVLAALYLKHLDRGDRVVFSKGHSCLALYAVLFEAGYLGYDALEGYSKDGGTLHGHPKRDISKGIELSTGSLGHGLSVACGMAYADRSRKVFCVLSDGEMNEGSTWEALMFGAQHKLTNLTAIIDANGLESLDKTENILGIEPLWNRLEAFGWEPVEFDGHDFDSIIWALNALPFEGGRPNTMIARTHKGHGVSFMENQTKWHYRCPTDEEYAAAVKELT